MNAKKIALILIPLNIILAYFVYNSVDSEVVFQRASQRKNFRKCSKTERFKNLTDSI